MVLKMPLTAKTPKDSTQIIYSLVGTLTELDPNITEISSPIEQSNAFIKEVTSEIEQLNTKNKLIKLGNLALLEQKLPDLKKNIDLFIGQLTFGKIDAENITKDFNNVIQSLVKATDKLSETDPLKTDALSIISLNNLKLKNINNQITAATNQITLLERFKSITLYHLSDTINNNKQNKELPLISEMRRVLQKLKKGKKYDVYIALCAFFLAGYNYLATTYYYVSDHVEKIPQQISQFNDSNTFGFSARVADFSDSFLNTITIFSNFAGILALIMIVFAAVTRNITGVIMGVFVGMICTFAPVIFKSVFENESVTYIEKTVTEYYEFYNFGFEGTIVFFVLAGVYLYMAHRKYKAVKQYKSLISKLDNEQVDNDHRLL